MSSRIGPNLETELFASERKELETVLESGLFAVSSNAAKLLRFVCEHHFSNASDPITEYDVAIHVLGRRADFDPQRDSIVRVEAHRVRKRLEEYYEKDGAGHAVKILLSRGQYGPTFVHTEPMYARCSGTPGAPSTSSIPNSSTCCVKPEPKMRSRSRSKKRGALSQGNASRSCCAVHSAVG